MLIINPFVKPLKAKYKRKTASMISRVDIIFYSPFLKSQNPSPKFQVPNSKTQIPNPKFQIPNSKTQVPKSFKPFKPFKP
jgi:hypothetical protein